MALFNWLSWVHFLKSDLCEAYVLSAGGSNWLPCTPFHQSKALELSLLCAMWMQKKQQ